MTIPRPDDKPYKPLKDDATDVLLAKYLNELGGGKIISPKAIQRVGAGVYTFAKKTKVMIKSVNNKLIGM